MKYIWKITIEKKRWQLLLICLGLLNYSFGQVEYVIDNDNMYSYQSIRFTPQFYFNGFDNDLVLNNNNSLQNQDTLPPIINFSSKAPYFTNHCGPFNINVNIADKSGVDTAILIYKHNNAIIDSVGFYQVEGNLYRALIDTLPCNNFAMGDSIQFCILATDASVNHNTTISPQRGSFQFILNASKPTSDILKFPFREGFES